MGRLHKIGCFPYPVSPSVVNPSHSAIALVAVETHGDPPSAPRYPVASRAEVFCFHHSARKAFIAVSTNRRRPSVCARGADKGLAAIFPDPIRWTAAASRNRASASVRAALVGDVESGRGIEAAGIGAVLADDAAQHRGRIGSDRRPALHPRLDHVQHLLGDFRRQGAHLSGNVFMFPLGQLGRVDQFGLPIVWIDLLPIGCSFLVRCSMNVISVVPFNRVSIGAFNRASGLKCRGTANLAVRSATNAASRAANDEAFTLELLGPLAQDELLHFAGRGLGQRPEHHGPGHS